MGKPVEVTVTAGDIDIVTGFALSAAGCGEVVMQAAARLNRAAAGARLRLLRDAGVDADSLRPSDVAVIKALAEDAG